MNIFTEFPDSLRIVTPFSKYLSMVMFVLLPFIGSYIGYMYATKQVVESEKSILSECLECSHEKVTEVEKSVTSQESELKQNIFPNSLDLDREYAMVNIQDIVKGWPYSINLLFDRELYVFAYDPRFMGDSVIIYRIPSIDLDTLESLGKNYYRDKDHVFYVSTGWGAYTLDANPNTFQSSYGPRFSRDDTSLYLREYKFEGIDVQTVRFAPTKEDGNYEGLEIVYDEDTVWIPDGWGGEGTITYRKGTMEEMEDIIRLAE